MKRGYLSEYFQGVASKRLSTVEINPKRSHQHEFNGDDQLKALLGTVSGTEKARFPATVMYFNEDADRNVVEKGTVTWYDSRARSFKRTGRSEYRLYFSNIDVGQYAHEHDLLVLAKRADGSVVALIAEKGSTLEQQLVYLFKLELTRDHFFLSDTASRSDRQLDYIAKYILEQIGIEVDDANNSFLDGLIEAFHGEFPPTSVFSEYARMTLGEVDPVQNPDMALVSWMEREEVLFKTLEKYFVEQRLRKGFGTDVEAFISYSLSVQNRRKSRSGAALESHLAHIFKCHKVKYSAHVVTENNARPDFIFPGIHEYKDPSFPAIRLKMLGAKTTCKDRWRQVLSEAKRIKNKHLFTLEPGISESQTSEMQSHKLNLVIPETLKSSYTNKQQIWLLSLRDFISIVR